MTEVRISMPGLLGLRRARLVGAGLLAAAMLWAAAYGFGLWPWLGYAARSAASVNAGRFPVGEGSSRTRFGFGTFVFFKGQTIVLAYDADIGAGCLALHVWRIAGADASRCIGASGEGEWTVPVTATGIYHIYAAPRPVAGRWQMSYSVWWGART